MSRTDTWMPLYIGDYMADTMHLTGAQHGAYLLLLMHSWRTGPLPDDATTLATIARTEAAAWKRMAPTILAFFDRTDAGLVNPRLEREREKAAANNDQRSAAGRAGAAKRWRNGGGDHGGGGQEPRRGDGGTNGGGNGECNASAMPSPLANAWQNDGPSPSPSKIPPSPPSEVRPPQGTRLPPDWRPSAADEAFARGHSLDPNAVAAKFRDHWHGKAGQAGRKADWSATWRNWCRTDAERRPRAGASPQRATRFTAAAEDWLGRDEVDRQPHIVHSERLV